jgi:hypothetical protein
VYHQSYSIRNPAKDLSHVPCKFFKVGSCTAGSTCPFSHHLAEPGQQKQVCTWFVKGSCKFGHKCALAHILPGQPPTMDRRNKRAALAAAGGGAGRGGDRDKRGGAGVSSRQGHPEGSRDGDAIGSRKDGPGSHSKPLQSRAPITISKAGALPLPSTISAPVTAPPLHDSDFTFAVGFSDNLDHRRPSIADAPTANAHMPTSEARQGIPFAPSNAPIAASDETATNGGAPLLSELDDSQGAQQNRKPSPLPLSRPSANRRISLTRNNLSGDFGFGPVGSPPRSSPRNGGGLPVPRAAASSFQPGVVVNGFSPGTSPASHKLDYESPGGFGTSPFSPPGAKSIFMSYSLGGDGFNATNQTLLSKPTQTTGRAIGHSHSHSASLLDRTSNRLWEPFNRRESLPRNIPDSGLSTEEAVEDEDLEEFIPSSLTDLLTPSERERRLSRTGGLNGSHRPSVEAHHQRYPHSLPANTLLDNVKSLWDGTGADHTLSSPFSAAQPPKPARSGLSPEPLGSGINPNTFSNTPPPFLNPSTLNTRAYTGQSFPSTSDLPAPVARPAAGISAGAALAAAVSNSNPSSSMTPGNNPGNFFGFHQSEAAFNYSHVGAVALSPSTRARRSHEPGQSLPQGLAAGLSRLHLIPPPATSASPPTIPGLGSSPGSLAGADWHPGAKPPISHTAGLSPPSSSYQQGRGQSIPFALQNGVGIRKPWMGHALSSPLSQPVNTNDEEDGLFAMDDEK